MTDTAETTFLNGLKKTAALEPELGDTLEPLPGPIQVDGPDIESAIRAPGEKREPVTKANLFQNADTHPLIFYLILLDKYGPIWATWIPDSVWLAIEKDYKTTIAAVTKEKINALLTLLRVDGFWQEWDVFEKICHALNNNIVRFDIIQPPTLGQMFNAVHIAHRLRSDMKFEEEVARYVSGVADLEGVEYLPKPLHFAQRYIGKIPQDVMERLDALTRNPWTYRDLKETAADIQALRILVGQTYTNYRKNQLKEQAGNLSI